MSACDWQTMFISGRPRAGRVKNNASCNQLIVVVVVDAIVVVVCLLVLSTPVNNNKHKGAVLNRTKRSLITELSTDKDRPMARRPPIT